MPGDCVIETTFHEKLLGKIHIPCWSTWIQILATPLPIGISPKMLSGRQQVLAQVSVSLSSMWETQIEFQTPGSDTAPLWQMQVLGE